MAKKKAALQPEQSLTSAPTEQVLLSQLHPDTLNPRFAASLGPNVTEEQVIDCIVEIHGIDDVISSIGTNGYFRHEPLLGLRPTPDSPITIVEGNRRLAACLILAGDTRAESHLEMRERFRGMPGYGIQSIPVTILEQRDRLLIAYLGIRHIAGAQPWDGYAKAAWVASVLEDDFSISIADITQMTGDKNRTISRLVEGYYFVQQLIGSDRFNPAESLRSGRRSSAEFPFSWVYTILGFSGIREWLDIQGNDVRPEKHPVPEKALDRAELLVDLMFGNRSRRRDPVISDSRQLQDLAKVVNQPKIMALLERGVSITQAVFQTKRTDEQIGHHLQAAIVAIEQADLLLGGAKLQLPDARILEGAASELRSRAVRVHKFLLQVIADPEEDES